MRRGRHAALSSGRAAALDRAALRLRAGCSGAAQAGWVAHRCGQGRDCDADLCLVYCTERTRVAAQRDRAAECPTDPTPGKSQHWNPNSVRNILRNSAYSGIAYYGTTHPTPAQRRRWALGPWGQRASQRPAPAEEWLPVTIPAIISPETFAAAQARMEQNQQMAKRNNTQHDYLLRGLLECARCQYAYSARTVSPVTPITPVPAASVPNAGLKAPSVRPRMSRPAPWIRSSGDTPRSSQPA